MPDQEGDERCVELAEGHVHCWVL